MGLQLVELVMCIEKRFRVRIPDEVASTCETVGDLAAAVLSQLPHRSERPYMRRFFRIRALLMKHAGAARRDVRPDVRLDSLLPESTRRAAWRAMRAEDDLLPRLKASKIVGRSGCTLCLVIGAGALLSMVIGWWYADGIRVLAACIGGPLWCAGILKWMSTYTLNFPDALVTVADLVRATTPYPIPELDAERTANEREVLDAVQELIHRECKIPLDQIRAESRLIKDLKLD